MRQMIDPSTIKVDTSNLAKLDMAKEDDKYYSSETFYSDKSNNSVTLYTGITYPSDSGIGICTPGANDGRIRLGKYAKWDSNGYGDEFWEIRNNRYQLNFIRVDLGKVHNIRLGYPSSGDAWILTDRNVKTIFGQSIYPKGDTGNIDLYKHNLKGVSGDNQVYIHITSSKNTHINSITDLNTYLSNDDYYPATGVYKDGTTFYPIVFMTKSSNVWSVTYNKGTELGTALISAVAETITDTVTTV